MTATVRQLWRYPVKSMGGETVDAVELDARGVAGDRQWAVITAEGRIASGKTTRRFGRVDGLLELGARVVDGRVVVALPSGERLAVDDPGLERALERAVGQPVSVARDPAATHFDAAPLHLVTTASLDWLRARVPGVPVDARRLRPNLVVDAGPEVLAEDAWVGRTLAVGDAVLEVVERTERCVMTTFAQGDLPAAPAVLERIARDNAACLGVYARVVKPGTVRVGDAAIAT